MYYYGNGHGMFVLLGGEGIERFDQPICRASLDIQILRLFAPAKLSCGRRGCSYVKFGDMLETLWKKWSTVTVGFILLGMAMANPTPTSRSTCKIKKLEQFFQRNMTAVKTLFDIPPRTPRYSEVIHATCEADDRTESVRDLCDLRDQLLTETTVSDLHSPSSSVLFKYLERNVYVLNHPKPRSPSSSECPRYCELLMKSVLYLPCINQGLIQSNSRLLGQFFQSHRCMCGSRCERPQIGDPDTTNQVYMSFFEASVHDWHLHHRSRR